MKNITFFLLAVIFLGIAATNLNAQVAINNSASTPDASAILDLNTGNAGVNKGFLAPQVALTNVTVAAPVNTPAIGLMVYSTSAPTGGNGSGYYYWNGSEWVNLGGTSATLANLTQGTGIIAFTYNGSSAATVELANTTVAAGSYGSATSVPTYTVNAQGQITNAADVAISASDIGAVAGSGANDYVARWTPSGTTLGTGMIQDNGATVGINGAPANAMLYVNSTLAAGDSSVGATYGVYGVSNNGYGVYGVTNSYSDGIAGVYGVTNGEGGAGVYGSGGSTSSTTYGVYGNANTYGGTGVYGTGGVYGGYFLETLGGGAAVYGDGILGGQFTGSYTGVEVSGGTYGGEFIASSGEGVNSSGTTYGVYATTSDPSSLYSGVYGNDATDFGVWGTSTSGNGVSGSTVSGDGLEGYSSGSAGVPVYADNASSGGYSQLAYYNGTTEYKVYGTGNVSTVVKDTKGNNIVLHAPETPEVYFEDYGEGQLVNGKAHIDLDPNFAKNVTINEKHPLRVFIQLEENENCKGVITKNKTVSGFDVVELNGGTSNTPFEWHIVCNRADEVMMTGVISHNADIRFEKGTDDATILAQRNRMKERLAIADSTAKAQLAVKPLTSPQQSQNPDKK